MRYQLIDHMRTVLINRERTWSHKSRALFLDRDGVVIKDKHYIKRPEDVEIIDGINEVMSDACRYSIPIFIITNQSGIARGLFSWKEYIDVTTRMIQHLKHTDQIYAIYANGYKGISGDKSWRKPEAGMILEAEKSYGIDLGSSYLIGDRITDLIAGAKSGIGNIIKISQSNKLIQMQKNSRPNNRIEDLQTIIKPWMKCYEFESVNQIKFGNLLRLEA